MPASPFTLTVVLLNIIFFSFYLIDNQLCVHTLRESAFIKEELHRLGLP